MIIAPPQQPGAAGPMMPQNPRSMLAAALAGAGGGPPAAGNSAPLIDPMKIMQLAKMGQQQPQAIQQPSRPAADQYEMGRFGRMLSERPLSQAMNWFQPSAMNAYQGPAMAAAPASALMTPTGFTGG